MKNKSIYLRRNLYTFWIFIFFAFTAFPLKAQTTIFSEDFEGFTNGLLGNTAVGGWQTSVNYSCNNGNYWGIFSSDNNITNRSLMIVGVSTSCTYLTPYGNYYTGTSTQKDVYTSVTSTGYQALQLDFDWRSYGEYSGSNIYDYGQVIYRVGSGAWNVLSTGGYNNSGKYYRQTSVTHQTVTLPSNLNNTNFQLGFRWVNDNSGGTIPAFVIDNMVIKGTTIDYCKPSTESPYWTYITNVSFLGTLNDVSNASTYTTSPSPGGYQDFRGLANKAIQAQGEGINIAVSGNIAAQIRAWVDWNKNGVFDHSSEMIYDTGNIASPSTTFGFVVPAGQPPGDYTIRLRNFKTFIYGYGYDWGYDFTPCEPFYDIYPYYEDEGEAEDYTFTVIASCNAKISSVTDGERCGSGTVALGASGTSGTTQYRWYANEFGGSPLATTSTGSWTTPNLTNTTTYWVTAYNGTCESTHRTAVVAKINPTPEISFTTGAPDICGDITSVIVTSSGDKETTHLIDEHFNSGLGMFSNVIAGVNNSNTNWTFRSSTFKPTIPVPYTSLSPAIASGSAGNGFACAISDVNPGSSVDNRLTLTGTVNTTDFLNLNLDFRMYFVTTAKGAAPNDEYVNVDVSTDGVNWTTVQTYTTDEGIPNRFAQKNINLNSYINQPNLKIRFVFYAWATTNQWFGNAFAIDDIELYGDKPLSTNFTWTGDPVVFANDCVSTVPSGGAESICIKPTEGQLENEGSWTVNATATLSNGCDATGTITINNNSKTWNTTASSDWASLNWKPDTAIPTDDKCVVIKTPVNISNVTNAVAKNITIKSGGKLEIAGNLTVEEKVVNENTGTGAADQFVLLSSTENSNANYLQNSNTPNTSADGVMRAERRVTDMDNVLSGTNAQMDYVYWSAPVSGQKLRGTVGEGGFSPGTPNNRFFEYNEATDYFVSTPDATFAPGKGYAIRAEDGYSNGYDKTYVFRGVPNNGEISINIKRSDDVGTVQHGFNLVGNPYPSNIDFTKLYANNSGLIFNTAYFWTNTTYTQYQQGSSYAGNNYAVFSGTGGNPPTGSSYQTAPNGIVKVGQSFMIQKRNVSGPEPLVFKNSYGAGQDLRVTTSGTFYQKGAGDRDRFWLQLVSPANLTNTQLIGYVEGASSGFEQDYDVEIMGLSSDIFYSKADDKQLLIQGKGLFNVADKVALGASFFSTGNYTIRLDHAEGVFANGQPIYLKDKATGVITDLSQGSYTFAAAKGVSDGRFEIIYTPETILSTDSSAKDDLVVYRDRDDFVIKSHGMKMTGLEVYDGAGRLIFSSKPNQTETRIPGTAIGNGMYLLQVDRNGTMTAKKILK